MLDAMASSSEKPPLQMRSIKWWEYVTAPEKANIETEKANIEIQKANIEKAFTTKTAANVIRLWEAFGYHTVFGRSDVVKLLGLKPTRSSELLRDMADRRVIVPVSGQGKGKYRFRIC